MASAPPRQEFAGLPQDSPGGSAAGEDAAFLSPRVQYSLLALIVLLAAALRFYKLGEWSFWIDEIYSVGRAQTHVNLPTILRELWHPSISVILTGISLKLFGTTEWTARLAPAVIGILTIPVLFFPARRLLGPHAALLASLLLAVSPWHIEWSQNSRFFSSLALLYTAAAIAFFYAAEGRGWRYVLLFYLLLVLALGERFIAAAIGPALVVFVLLLKLLRCNDPAVDRRLQLRAMLLPGIAAVALDLLRFAITGESFFLSWASLTYSQPVSNPLSMGVMIARDVGVPALVFGAFAGVRLVRDRNRAGLLFLTCALVPILMVLILNPVMFTKDRYAFVALPSLLMLTAAGIRSLALEAGPRGRFLAIGVAAALVADALSTDMSYFRVNHGHRLDWRSAFGTVESLAGPEDRLVAGWPEFARFYTARQITPWVEVDSTTVLAAATPYWFVVDSETIHGNTATRRWLEREGRLMAVYYLHRSRSEYLRVYLHPPQLDCSAPRDPGCTAHASGAGP